MISGGPDNPSIQHQESDQDGKEEDHQEDTAQGSHEEEGEEINKEEEGPAEEDS